MKRVQLILTPNNKPVPFNHLNYLTGCIHKWIGENNVYHGKSAFSFSFLSGGEKNKNFLNFKNGSTFFISSYHDELIRRIILGMRSDPNVIFGMRIREIIITQNTPDLSNVEKFNCGSPVLVKKDGRHFKYNEKETNEILTFIAKRKLRENGLSENIDISFDQEYQNPKVKLYSYNKIENKVNKCSLIIKGNPESKEFIWCMGVGNSNGIGFGSII